MACPQTVEPKHVYTAVRDGRKYIRPNEFVQLPEVRKQFERLRHVAQTRAPKKSRLLCRARDGNVEPMTNQTVAKIHADAAIEVAKIHAEATIKAAKLHAVLGRRDPTLDMALTGEIARLRDLAETAWGLIANAHGGDWDQASEASGWKAAAERFRDEYHASLDRARDTVRLTTLIAVWELIHGGDTGALGFGDLDAALSKAGVDVVNDVPGCGSQRCGPVATQPPPVGQ